MRRTWNLVVWVGTLASVLAAETASGQARKATDLVKAGLLADTSAVQGGKAFRVGMRLRIEPGYHVYWRNPGDAGQATAVTFDLPEGFMVSDVGYPVPAKFLQPGDLVAYGYGEEVMLIATVTPPQKVSGEVKIGAKVKYLVCDDQQCLPGRQETSVTVSAGDAAEPANDAAFAEWGRQIPVAGSAVAEVADVKASAKGGKCVVDVAWRRPAENVEFFPGANRSVNVHDVTVKNKGQRSQITFDAEALAGQQAQGELACVVAYVDERGVRRGMEVPVKLNPDSGKK